MLQMDVMEEAASFIETCYRELDRADEVPARIQAVRQSIAQTGTYEHTFVELQHGARMAWRNSTRCIGRLFWKSLQVMDARGLVGAEALFEAMERHLAVAGNQGRIRSLITIFRPQHPQEPEGIVIENSQLIRYAGYQMPDGSVLGDPAQVAFTRRCMALGWTPAERTRFDILPWVLRLPGAPPVWRPAPAQLIQEVPLEHPLYPWWRELGLKWHALPVISDMILEIGGIRYPAAPFNGWYMGTEIGSRNLGDSGRYNLLPEIAARMGLSTGDDFMLWKDRALLELNTSVLYSFEKNGVRIANHHEASEQFVHFEATEARKGRAIGADWSWIVPPMSASATEVFHRTYENRIEKPNFFYRTPSALGCPFSRGPLEQA